MSIKINNNRENFPVFLSDDSVLISSSTKPMYVELWTDNLTGAKFNDFKFKIKVYKTEDDTEIHSASVLPIFNGTDYDGKFDLASVVRRFLEKKNREKINSTTLDMWHENSAVALMVKVWVYYDGATHEGITSYNFNFINAWEDITADRLFNTWMAKPLTNATFPIVVPKWADIPFRFLNIFYKYYDGNDFIELGEYYVDIIYRLYDGSNTLYKTFTRELPEALFVTNEGTPYDLSEGVFDSLINGKVDLTSGNEELSLVRLTVQFIKHSDGDPISDTYEYVFKDCSTRFNPVLVSWQNSIGGMDSFTFYARNTGTLVTEAKVIGIKDDEGLDTKVFSKNCLYGLETMTDWLTQEESEYLEGLYTSPYVTIQEKDEQVARVIHLDNEFKLGKKGRKGLKKVTCKFNYERKLRTM